MHYTPSTLQKAGLDSDQSGPGGLVLRNSPKVVGNESSTSNAQDGASLERSRMGVETNPSRMDDEKPTDISENLTSFHAPNHDDSAIDLDDDSMLMTVGKYGDMMVSDPADAEGDVIVI